jgi:hypothetical protein
MFALSPTGPAPPGDYRAGPPGSPSRPNVAPYDSLWLRRALSVGHRRKLLNLVGQAVMVNGRAGRAQMRPLGAGH